MRGNAAALKFIDGIHQPGQKLRFRLHSSIGFQTAAKLTGYGSQGHNSAAVVQARKNRRTGIIGNTTDQAGKRQHFRISAGSISGCGTKHTLTFVADQFRNQEDPVSFAAMNILRDTAEDFLCIR